MADFIEVMRQFDRMCKAHAGCVDCPLAIKGTVETKCSISSFVDESEYVMRKIMSLAAEHPEPVYPTWEEWLQSVGVMESSEGLLRRIQGQLLIDGIPAHAVPTSKVLQPMDADIAQKLGIEPKEG